MEHPHARPLSVLLPCPGLGRVARGFETFARECFEALSGRDDVRIVLAKGWGEPAEREVRVRTIHRDNPLARAAGEVARRDGYFVEQLLFSMALMPTIRRERPDLVFVSDWFVAAGLVRWRRVARSRFAIVLSSGGPFPPPYNRGVDHVQQLTPTLMDIALDYGEPPERHTLLPYGVHVDPSFEAVTPERRAQLRERLGLPADRTIVLSVAALNRWLKRIDYLIEEVASIEPERRPYLVILGQAEAETPGLLALAEERLGPAGFLAHRVPKEELPDWYDAADAFALTSTSEGFGRVFLEALARGLPVLAHDYPITHYVLGEHGHLADLRQPGELARLLAALGPADQAPERQAARHRAVAERFSWEALAPAYVDMFRRAVQSTSVR